MRGPTMAAAACAAALTLGGVVACGGGGGGGAKSGGEKPVRVAMIMASLDNDFYVAQKQGIDAQAAKEKNAKITVSAGRERSSTDEVASLIEDAIAKDVDAIAVNGSDDAPLLPALREVIKAKIPLVLFDAQAPQLAGQYAAYIGTDNRAGGEAGGRWLRKHMPQGGQLGILLCVAGNPITNARVAGFKAGLGDAPFKVVAQADAQCDRQKGRDLAEDMISAHPNLDAVFSTSDTQSLGAVAAFKAAHKDPTFVSFDAQPEAVKDMESGNVIDASVAWSAKTIGADAVKAAVAAARGQHWPRNTMVPVTVVDKTNAAEWKG